MSEWFASISPLSHALGFHMERQNVLTSNVAHIDTPGYRPMELERTQSQDFGQVLSVSMTRTAEGHYGATAADSIRHGRVVTSADMQAGLDGNFVSLDIEATKLAENQLRYEVVSTLTTAELKKLSYVASDAKG